MKKKGSKDDMSLLIVSGISDKTCLIRKLVNLVDDESKANMNFVLSVCDPVFG